MIGGCDNLCLNFFLAVARGNETALRRKSLTKAVCRNPSPLELRTPRRTDFTHWAGEMQPETWPLSLMGKRRYLFWVLHQSQRDDDAEQRQAASDIEGIDIAAEHVLCLTCYEPSCYRADAIG
jgi:hypothetical protein